jgi:hypothetical protein
MKKLLIAIFVLCVGITTMVSAQTTSKATEEYSAMDLGIWFGLPTSMETANVRGWRLGLPISAGQGYVRGLESSLFCAATDRIEGLQFSCVAVTKDLSGTQISLVNVCNGEAKGSQFGVVNHACKKGWQIGLVNNGHNARFQLGLINLNEGGLWPFSFLVNFGKDTFKSSETIREEAVQESQAK